ncbi:tRNA 2-thiocytidine(32) synthetase TtcA [Pseudenhygromyxa sp. WMMC2535]|uniref:tRNA 2-thiocytidine(32) synthetase TtcA n=1 Tax=Pseudenhygromyxa sp. WMMC2535 TaxID=2712867 RepID=UPI001553CA00|nr:tRNA 2-thiocytidine(32) synthetase TtcA [Pseudenhygromyxa sp. WMMC2535]NVB40060.1 tRNA 2-thiocytidine(32) synthetase TtcA [Pseudenhygromyxa sp. WMMC2535]
MNREQLERRLLRQISRLNRSMTLIEPGDRIMVAVSGGKDSWAMLHLLRAYERRLPFDFELIAVNLDQGHPGFPVEILREHLEAEGFAHRLVARDTHTPVKANTPAGKAFCSLCSRLRRGILYDVAVELGATKIALGHHRDDVIETLLLNLFYAGQIKAMPAKLRSDDGRNVIIRPLATCAEAEIAAYAEAAGFPIVPCDLCGSQPNLKRAQVKALLAQLERDNPLLRKSLLAAVGNVKASHLWDASLAGAGAVAEVGEDDLFGEAAAAESELVPLNLLR